MKRLLKASAVAVLGMAMLAPAVVSAAPVPAQRRGRVVVQGGFGFYRPSFYRPYSPFWDPFWSPGFGYGYGYGYSRPRTMGELKINKPMKDSVLYIDNGFVGQANKFKSMQLAPGRHEVELRAPDGSTIFRENVTVVLGKTTEIRPGNFDNRY